MSAQLINPTAAGGNLLDASKGVIGTIKDAAEKAGKSAEDVQKIMDGLPITKSPTADQLAAARDAVKSAAEKIGGWALNADKITSALKALDEARQQANGSGDIVKAMGDLMAALGGGAPSGVSDLLTFTR